MKNASGFYDIDRNATAVYFYQYSVPVFCTVSKMKYKASTYKMLIITMMVTVLFLASFLGPVGQEKQN